jgi:N-acetylmuramoyl-L-alanine amidase
MKNNKWNNYRYSLTLGIICMVVLLWAGCGKSPDSDKTGTGAEDGSGNKTTEEGSLQGSETEAEDEEDEEDKTQFNQEKEPAENTSEAEIKENHEEDSKKDTEGGSDSETDLKNDTNTTEEALEQEEEPAPEPEVYDGETEGLETVRTTVRVNVRKEPSLEGAVYTKLPRWTEVSRIRDEGEWSAVYYEGYLLYIASAYLRAKPVGNSSGGESGASGEGYVIVIDPGHQAKANTNKEPNGPGSSEMKNKVAGGTRGTASGLAEYELTLQVSEKIREELENRGYTVIMTRESHDVDLSNSERAVIANENQADAFIRIHANGSNDTSVNGVMTICQTSSNPYNAAWYEESRRLSDYVLDEVTAATGAKKQYVWETDTMTGINWAQVPSTILEMGYMTNADEDLRMASDDYQDTIAEAVADAVDLFLQE